MNNDTEFKKNVYDHIRKYTSPSYLLATWHTAVTLGLLYFCFNLSTVFAAPFFGLVLVRTFVIFHDMAHNSFFPSKHLNRIFGLIFGTITFTPWSYWIKGHTYHHANANKLNREQHAQTAIWSVSKYRESSLWSRLVYAALYGKYTLFTINPSIYFIIMHRFVSNWYETVLQLAYVTLLYLYLDPTQYLYFCLSLWLGGFFGFILFHIQHTFDGAYRADTDNWRYFLNGMYGCSFVQVPDALKMFTCNIQYHHIHHLNSKVPFYYLDKCHNEGTEYFESVKRVKLSDIVRILSYSLYDSADNQFKNVYNYLIN